MQQQSPQALSLGHENEAPCIRRLPKVHSVIP